MIEETNITTKIITFEAESHQKCFALAAKYLKTNLAGSLNNTKIRTDCGMHCLDLWFLEDITDPIPKDKTQALFQARDVVKKIY